MKSTRRDFLRKRLPLATGLGALLVRHIPAQSIASRPDLEEIDRMIRREGRPKGLSRDQLPTPALLLDLDKFERNLRRMAQHARNKGKELRPHAKTHKCPEVARRQVEAGALGVCTATVPEAELMVAGGVRGVLLTSPILSDYKADRMARLASSDPELMVVVDHPRQVDMYEQAARNHGVTLQVLVDLNVGDGRTGTLPGAAGLELARLVGRRSSLRLRGLQAYSGRASHTNGFESRSEYSRKVMAQAVETREILQREGLPAEILSGASTGTYNIDSEIEGVTELQVGSYVFMDIDYWRIGGRDGDAYEDFEESLTVLATVVSANLNDRVTVDAGFKAFSTDRAFGPEPLRRRGLRFGWAGDEFGVLRPEETTPLPELGDRIEFRIPHCDPTVNLYDRIYACRGDGVEEIWSIMGRLPHLEA